MTMCEDASPFEKAIELDRNSPSPVSSEEALRLYREALKQGDLRAASVLGYFYEEGLGVDRDIDESMRLYRLAADGQDPTGQYSIGRLLFETGRFAEALPLLQAAAEQGVPQAHVILGKMYEAGQGVVAQPFLALEHFREAAELGNNVGRHLAAGYLRSGSPEDLQLALTYLRHGCKENDAACCWRLAVVMMSKGGVGEQVLELAARAAELGMSAAMEWYGHVCLGGYYGKEADVTEGANCLQKAAAMGSARAKYLLAFYILKQVIESKHPQEAEVLCREAAEQGDKEARKLLGRIVGRQEYH